MGDLYVHLRMRECCRKVFAELDRTKRPMEVPSGILAIHSLAKILGELTITEASVRVQTSVGSATAGGSHLDVILGATCERICSAHAAEHERKGEMIEGRFWWTMKTVVLSKTGGVS